LRPLLHETGVVVMVVMMMMMVGANNNHYLRLRRNRSREAEGEDESKQELFHIYWMLPFPEVALISVISFWRYSLVSALTIIYMPNFELCKYRFVQVVLSSYLQTA